MALAGVVTFPLLTRNLSVGDYGILGLITSSLTFFIAIGKLGVQHSVIRFFSQIKNNNIDFSARQMSSTVMSVFFLLAVITTLIWLLLGYKVLPRVFDYSGISTLFALSAAIIFVKLLGSGVINFLRAQQRSGIVATVTLIVRCAYVGLILLALFLTDINPFYVLLCYLVAEIAGVVFATRHYWPHLQFAFNDISAPLAKAMLLYGMPLMLLESLGLVLRLSDRYLIGALLDENALGMYSASYNFTSYIDFIILASLVQAIKPMYMELWESSGATKTQKFLGQGFHIYLVVGIPFIAIFSLVAPHLLNFLASPKYAPGTVIIPYVALSYYIEGSVYFLAAGLYIQKNTKVLMFWGALAAVINLVLNLIMIPHFGIVGAAVVTIIAYVIFVFGVSREAFKYVSFNFSLHTPAIVLAVSVIVYYLGFQIEYGNDITSFLLKGTISTLALSLLVYSIDSPVRTLITQRFPRLAL